MMETQNGDDNDDLSGFDFDLFVLPDTTGSTTSASDIQDNATTDDTSKEIINDG